MDLYHYLALNRIEGLGPAAAQRLLRTYPRPGELFGRVTAAELAALGVPEAAARAILRAKDDPGLRRDLAADLKWHRQAGHRIVHLGDSRYPACLREIHQPPPVLYVDGSVELLAGPALAMVGARRSSSSGRQSARELARELGRAGLTIVSGLALGIDAECHCGALDGGAGTIAVLATGIDRIYPRRHEDLSRRIRDQGGALVSEFPLGTPPLAGHFPRRNRIISGLCLGTLVVEAAERSGSLVTARHALEQGREVFAVPGSIRNATAWGCHRLIQQGAKLVQCAGDVLEELGLAGAAARGSAPAATPDASPLEAALLDVLDDQPLAVDLILERLPGPVPLVLSALAGLELRGWVVREELGYRRLGP
jgi:DNA processing protein